MRSFFVCLATQSRKKREDDKEQPTNQVHGSDDNCDLYGSDDADDARTASIFKIMLPKCYNLKFKTSILFLYFSDFILLAILLRVIYEKVVVTNIEQNIKLVR